MLDQINPRAQAGRTGHRLKVQDAKRLRMDVRNGLGGSREDPPNVAALLRAACQLRELLLDASAGELVLTVIADGEQTHPRDALIVIS